MLAAAAEHVDFFRWVPHPEVWALVSGILGLYVWAGRVIGPKVVPAGSPAYTRKQLTAFAFGLGLLWIASDWPVHDIGEKYLYLVHMSQHLTLTLVVPPLMLLATPEWLARLVVGEGRADRILHKLARPIPASILFNALVLLSHWPTIVNNASSNAVLHYGTHTVLVSAALIFWIPVCGPFPELRIQPPTQMIYLFGSSIVPTVPGAWMTFAGGALYKVYDIPQRLGGISVTSDQQVAGLIMKLVGGTYLWVLITYIFFTWAIKESRSDSGFGRKDEPVLTFDEVQEQFDRAPAPVEHVET